METRLLAEYERAASEIKKAHDEIRKWETKNGLKPWESIEFREKPVRSFMPHAEKIVAGMVAELELERLKPLPHEMRKRLVEQISHSSNREANILWKYSQKLKSKPSSRRRST